jgi:hypothetical protein
MCYYINVQFQGQTDNEIKCSSVWKGEVALGLVDNHRMALQLEAWPNNKVAYGVRHTGLL